jgi:hypothetical protein
LEGLVEQPDRESVEEHVTSILDQHFWALQERIKSLEEFSAAIEKKMAELELKVERDG